MASLENFRMVVFRTVAHQLSFRKAAEELYLTQPAVSLQIKALEEDLGVQLLDRSGSRVGLTAAGRKLLAYADQVHSLLGQAEHEVTAINGEHAGPLALGCFNHHRSIRIAPAPQRLSPGTLLVFPLIGYSLHLTQTQFGLWSALAIHDTSSVVGASAKFGAVALAVGATVKLARALWIVPISIGTSIAQKSKARIQWPWFILFFCLAAVANTYLPAFHLAYPVLKHLGIVGLTVTLFLIGTGLSRQTLREVGVRPLMQAIVLWVVVATGSLALIRAGLISL